MTTALNRHCLTIDIQVESPFLFQGLNQAQLGVDASQLRDSQGRVIIPGDQLKGLLRQAFTDLSLHAKQSGVDKELINALFGAPPLSEQDAAATPDKMAQSLERQRGTLLFSDLAADALSETLDEEEEQDNDGAATLTRIAIDDSTGSVKRGALQVVEVVAPIGQVVTFQGTLIARTTLDAERLRELIHKAGQLIPAIGAFKTAGFGRVEAFSVQNAEDMAAEPRPPLPLGEDGRVIAEITFDRPFLVGSHRIADNLFKGDPIIPGGVLKGALAHQLRLDTGQNPEENDALSRLTIGHAFPHRPGQDQSFATPIPHSVALYSWTDHGEPRKAIRDHLLDDSIPWHPNGGVGRFQADWKDGDWTPIKETLWYPAEETPPGYDARIHTAIDPTTGSANHGQLFGYYAVIPDGFVWRAEINTKGLDAQDAQALLEVLAGGLDSLGKTHARATVRLLPPPAREPLRPAMERDGATYWTLTLLTPALLNAPPTTAESLSGDHTPFDLLADYGTYWRDASGGTVDYVTHFGKQALVGGYQSLAFQRHQGTYAPWLSTEPGTVFLLKTKGSEGPAWLESRLDKGLPLHSALIAGPEPRPPWKVCPFLPENGYGAFSLDPRVHQVYRELTPLSESKETRDDV